MANHSRPIVLSPSDRRELQRLQRSSSGPSGLSRRARAVLLIADHISGAEVARRTGYTPVQVSRIRRVARHCRQLLDSYHCGRQGLARKASESAVSFHTHGGLLAEHGRSLVQHPDPQVGSPRLLRFGPLADPTHSQRTSENTGIRPSAAHSPCFPYDSDCRQPPDR